MFSTLNTYSLAHSRSLLLAQTQNSFENSESSFCAGCPHHKFMTLSLSHSFRWLSPTLNGLVPWKLVFVWVHQPVVLTSCTHQSRMMIGNGHLIGWRDKILINALLWFLINRNKWTERQRPSNETLDFLFVVPPSARIRLIRTMKRGIDGTELRHMSHWLCSKRDAELGQSLQTPFVRFFKF